MESQGTFRCRIELIDASDELRSGRGVAGTAFHARFEKAQSPISYLKLPCATYRARMARPLGISHNPACCRASLSTGVQSVERWRS
jgi:hypothetical protein